MDHYQSRLEFCKDVMVAYITAQKPNHESTIIFYEKFWDKTKEFYDREFGKDE